MSGLPERIGKYRVLEAIGRGGMGSVYKAHDPVLDRMVAMKVMTEGAEAGTEARERFLREAQSAARLNHPNIITVYELGEDRGQVFIVMELLEGEPLSRAIAASPPWPLRKKLAVMAQICDGLVFAHQRGVIHRDIKPGNIFVLDNGQVKILDFGIARLSSSELTRTGLLMGTPNYMSPEQTRGRRTDARSDIFSVGVLFYELVSGRRPFAGEDYFETMEKVRSEEPVSLAELDGTLPPALVSAVHRTLAKDPALRYQSLDDLRTDLSPVRDALESEAGGDLREAVERKFAEVLRLHRTLVAAVGAAALGAETLPLVDPQASDAGLETFLRELESQTERLRAIAQTVERLEPAVERGIAAFEQRAFGDAVAELEAVLREIPQHQRARDYHDRARLEQIRERTVRSLGPGPLTADAMPTRRTPGPPRAAAPAAAVAVATPHPAPLEPNTALDATRWVSGGRSTGVLAAIAMVALVGGGGFLFWPEGRKPTVTSPPVGESRPRPETPPAPPPTPAAAATPGPAGSAPGAASKREAPAAKPPAPGTDAGSVARPASPAAPPPRPARLTREQTRAVTDHLELAQFHRERGDDERALAEYQRALDIDPANTEARKGVADVEAALKKARR